MNKAKLIELFESGAYFVGAESKIYHASFKKGWRKMMFGDVSLRAAEKELGDRLKTIDGVQRIYN